MMKSTKKYIKLLADFKAKRGKIYGISRIGIFGSVALGEQNKKSDLDIYYEGEPLSLFKVVALKDELEGILHCTVDILRIHETMNQRLKKRIENEGIYV